MVKVKFSLNGLGIDSHKGPGVSLYKVIQHHHVHASGRPRCTGASCESQQAKAYLQVCQRHAARSCLACATGGPGLESVRDARASLVLYGE